MVEVVETKVNAVAERCLKVGITYAYAHRVAFIGHWLQLSYRWLACASAVVDLQTACLAKLIAEAQEWCWCPQPRCGYIALGIEQIAAFLHCSHQLNTGIEVVLGVHFLIAELYGLAEELVAELAALGLIEYVKFLIYVEIALKNVEKQLFVVEHRESKRIFHGAAQFLVVEQAGHKHCCVERCFAHCTCHLTVVNVLVAIVEAIIAAIGKLQEVAVLHIAQWFGPSDTAVHAIGPSVILDELANIFVGSLFVIIFVEGVSIAVLMQIAVGVAYLGAEAATLALLELVVIHKLSAKFVARTVVNVLLHAMVDRRRCLERRTSARLRYRVVPTAIEVKGEIWAEFQCIERVDLPLHAESAVHIVAVGL